MTKYDRYDNSKEAQQERAKQKEEWLQGMKDRQQRVEEANIGWYRTAPYLETGWQWTIQHGFYDLGRKLDDLRPNRNEVERAEETLNNGFNGIIRHLDKLTSTIITCHNAKHHLGQVGIRRLLILNWIVIGGIAMTMLILKPYF